LATIFPSASTIAEAAQAAAHSHPRERRSLDMVPSIRHFSG
jgi:hypothetical protein